MTNAAGSVLQLAVSMDYSIFLLHRFSENREEGLPVEKSDDRSGKAVCGGAFFQRTYDSYRLFSPGAHAFSKSGRIWAAVMSKAIVLSLVRCYVSFPALAISTYRLIDKHSIVPLNPKFDKFAGMVMKLRSRRLCLSF